MKRIHDSLNRVFESHRLVFWYDGGREWMDTFNSFELTGVTKLIVAGNEFGTKVRIVRDADPESKFLIYAGQSRPPDADNWLLDLLLTGYEYKADKASLALQDVGLSHAFLALAEEHAVFFNSAKRTGALREIHHPAEDTERDIRLKMVAILAGTAVDMDAMLLRFLDDAIDEDGLIDGDPVDTCLGSCGLTGFFWREASRLFGYQSDDPSLRDFAVVLFRGANPLDLEVSLHPHAKVFLQRWKDSQNHRAAFQQWSRMMEQQLQVKIALDDLASPAELGDSDTFELFDKCILHRLCADFVGKVPAVDLQRVIQSRRASIWYSAHEQGYKALENAIELRQLLESVELAVDSIAGGFKRYVSTWWRVDMAYRRCMWNIRCYKQVAVMEPVAQWVEGAYVNNFLLPLNDRWSDQVRTMTDWKCPDSVAQTDFFSRYVQPFLNKGQKVFVIVSDALRYEAASDYAQRLQSANRWTASVEAMFGVLPSYTQLGMAALLPGSKRMVDAEDATVTLDGVSTTGTSNRSAILNAACGGKAVAIQAEDFLELNSKTDGRALMRDNEVVYIYHNLIDKTGDAPSTEARTFDAVEKTFEEIDQIIKKVANINGSNMLLTSDHGFIFQQSELADEDLTPLPASHVLTFRNRRFAIGSGIVTRSDIKIFSSHSLGLTSSWDGAFPLSLGRYPLQGSGKRYVHGGVSLQEVVVPVVKIHKARADDTGKVDVEILRAPVKITTGQVSLSLLQDRQVQGKILPRNLRVSVCAKNGTLLSDIKTLTFDSREPDARQREVSVLLTMAHVADSYNNQDVDIRLEELIAGTKQIVTYKSYSLKLQKPFASDFDDN